MIGDAPDGREVPDLFGPLDGGLRPAVEPDAYAMLRDLARWSSGEHPDQIDALRRVIRLVADTSAVTEAVGVAAHAKLGAQPPEAAAAQLVQDLVALQQAAVAVAEHYGLTDVVRAQVRQLWLTELRHRSRRV